SPVTGGLPVRDQIGLTLGGFGATEHARFEDVARALQLVRAETTGAYILNHPCDGAQRVVGILRIELRTNAEHTDVAGIVVEGRYGCDVSGIAHVTVES